MTLSPAFLDEVRARTSLSSVIQRKVKLTKAGREMRGCCPFHQEKSASFYVNDDKGFYHCFGCSAHGDAIRWMTDHEGLQFLDAVRELAAAAGLEMPDRDPRHADQDREREAMLEVMDRAARVFREILAAPFGEQARRYLADRGVSDATVAAFGIGCSPGRGKPLSADLRDVGVPTLERLGLARMRDDEVVDFFRNRVIFPIRDQRGRTIAFGGRVMGKGEPKYLNSPDTPIFDKGQTLFNIDRAGPAARAAKRLLVVEGYMDVIGLAGAGVDEAVAPNGTALTEAQIARLWKLAGTPILCFDGDKAGRAAAARAALRALPLLEPDRSLAFVTPPDGKDPDDVARDGGRAAIDAMLAAPRALVDVVWQHERDAAPCETPEQVAGLKSRLREHVRSIRNIDVRDAYGQEMARRFAESFGTPAPTCTTEPRRAPRAASDVRSNRTSERPPFSRRERPQTSTSKAVGRGSMAANVERAILAGLLAHVDVVVAEIEVLASLPMATNFGAALLDVLVDYGVAGAPAGDIPGLAGISRIVEWAETGPLRFTFTDPAADPAQARRDLVDAIYQLRR